jgi:hypothetical protein
MPRSDMMPALVRAVINMTVNNARPRRVTRVTDGGAAL